MKKTGLFAASFAAVSATALSAQPSSAGILKTNFSNQEKNIMDEENTATRRSPPLTAADQFAPRFDGLRFIETLVTAHR